MYAIKDMNSAGRVMMWVKQEPTWLPKEQYVEVSDELYNTIKYGTFWIDQNGNPTFEKPYTYKYHYLDNGRWRLDHDKVDLHIAQTKEVFSNNLRRYVEMGLEGLVANYMQQQINDIVTLDDVEEFTLVKFGGKYEAVYNHRYHIAI